MNRRLLINYCFKNRFLRTTPLRLYRARPLNLVHQRYFSDQINKETNPAPEAAEKTEELNNESEAKIISQADKDKEREEAKEAKMTEGELFRDRMNYGDGRKLGHITAYDDIPEPPPSGKTLMRDMILVTLFFAFLGYLRIKQREKVEKYPPEVGSELGLAKAHIQHSEKAASAEIKNYHLDQAEICCNKALRLLTSSLPDQNIENIDEDIILDDAGVVAIHKEIGKLCYLQGKYKISAEHYLIVMKALSKAFGFHCDELLEPCRHISECYVNLGQFKLAEHFLDRAVKIATGDEQLGAQLNEQFAIMYRRQAKWEEAIEKSEESLRLTKKIFGPTHHQVANILLGEVYSYIELVDLKMGMECATEALRILDMQNLPSYNAKCTTLFLMGKIFLLQGNKEQSMAYLNEALLLAGDLRDKTREVAIFQVLKEARKMP